MSQPIYISEETVKKLLNWDQTLQAVEVALRSVYEKNVVQSTRTFTKCTKSDSLLLTMPGSLANETFGAFGCKLVTLNKKNANLEHPLPTINAHVMLFDEDTGVLKAIISATEITTWRTAAASAVATKHLKPTTKFKTLAVLGAGTQGRIHAIAFNYLFDFEEIRIWNHNAPKAEQLANELNLTYGCQKFRAYQSNQECVKRADVIVTATFSEKPVVELEWLKQGAHINAVGAGLTHHSELSEAIYLASRVYIDHRTGAESELAGLGKLGVEFAGEVGGVIAGDLQAPPLDQITVFQSLGMAAEDCAMARLVYDLNRASD